MPTKQKFPPNGESLTPPAATRRVFYFIFSPRRFAAGGCLFRGGKNMPKKQKSPTKWRDSTAPAATRREKTCSQNKNPRQTARSYRPRRNAAGKNMPTKEKPPPNGEV
jgi:hypothetical protein